MDRADRVLHVDDDPEFAELTARFLEDIENDFDVVTEHSAADALVRLEEERVDCIVSDYQMPEMDGLAFLETVREDHPDLPFVLFTGRGSEEVASEAITAGATDYLQKQPGRGQYELLANRVRNAVEQYRARQRAEDLERIRRVGHEVNRALVRATSREAIEQSVCEIVSEADPYRFAWIGEHDPDSRTVVPRFAAGVDESYLDAVEITTDERPTARGPTGRAVLDRELAVMQDIPGSDEFEPWRAEALERGFRSSAAVPLGYEDEDYGVLNVYADRTGAFDDRERELLRELADDVSHAIYRIEERTPADRYAALIERLPVGICRLTAGTETEVLEANPAFLDTFGIESEAALRELDLADLLAESDQRRPLRDRLDGESLIQGAEVRGQTLGGEEVWLSVTALRSEGDEETDYDCIVRETTEEKRRERDLALFREAVEASGHSIYFTDVEGTIEYVNPAFEEVTGYSAEEAVGRTPRILKSGEHDQDFYRQLWGTILAGDVWRSELWNSRHSGEQYAVDQTIAPVDGPAGDVEHFVAVNSDITDRKERERELERYESIVQASGDAVYMLDPAGRFTFVNDALTRIAGYEESELLGSDVSILMNESDIETGEALIQDLLETDSKRAKFEMAIQTASGEALPMENHITTIETEDGNLDASIGIVRDISERKAREEALERQNERLEEFAGVVSHDLRNPLNVAMSRLELMEETEGTNDHAEAVNRSLGRMESLIDDLLALTREGSAVEETVPVYLANAVEACWRNVDTEEATLRAETDLVLRADASRLKQLLENLFRNAVEHGGEDVTVRVGDLEEGFFISDDGRGIPANQRERVFESGFTTGSAGTGLGLNIVEEVAEAHGWDVAVTESEDGGARFEVTGVDVVD